jgi:signal transduction histidine kinase
LDAWIADPQRTIQATVFDSSDGVRSHPTTSGYSPRVAKAPDGEFWFLPFDGVSVIDPHHIPFNKLPPPVHIEQIVADRKTYDTASDRSGNLRLPPLSRDLEIDYTALSLVAPEKNRFRYKLEGLDKDWHDVGNRREAFYTNLPPRHYRFRVAASNNSGVWNEEGAFLDFAVAPAYYQTNWFRALCVVIVASIIWAAHRLRVRALEKRQALLEQHQTEIRALNEQMIKAQEAERMRISGDLHDGVLQQITSLTLRLGKVKRQVPPDSEATATVNSLQQQLIQIGTDIRHISHELHPALLQESGLPAALSSYCEEFSNVRGLPVSCETDESVEELSPGAALCLYRIAQEALGNAAKYSQARRVEVRLTRSNGLVRLTVSDDGVGCDPERIGKSGGLGVINMRERVLQLRGTFEFKSETGRGTTVKAEVPFRPAS